MIYTFEPNFFQNIDDSMTSVLDRLWHNIKDRHDLYLMNIEELKSSSWYQGLRESNKKELANLYIKSANISKKATKITISTTSNNAYSLIEAEAILTASLKIILENIEYDAYFLNATLRCYSKWGRKIREYKDKGWVEYINGGGENITNVVAELKTRFETQKNIFPKDCHLYIRAFILLDSDKQYANDLSIKPLHSIVLQSGIPHRILTKREKENYLPIEVYDEIQGNEKIVAAIKRLSPQQLDFFDVEKCFPDKNFNQLDANIQELYQGISEYDKNIFRKERITFKKDDGRKDSFKARFSQLFLSNKITKENMESRADSTGKAELESILQKIYELL